MNKYELLSRFIKDAGTDIIADHIAKEFYVNRQLGMHETDAAPEVLYVTDDSGYRSITLGDVRGNVSYDTGKRDDSLKKMGYVLIYSENARYGKYKYRCYPPIRNITKTLRRLANGEKVESVIYYPADGVDEDEFTSFIAKAVERFADAAEEAMKKEKL